MMRGVYRRAAVLYLGAAVMVGIGWTLDAKPAMKTKVEQYGITWEFDKAYPVGKFITGDWWVVGPVMVVRVTPAPGPVSKDSTVAKKNQFGDAAFRPNPQMRNGSMLVTSISGSQGYDSRVKNYKPGLSVRFPLQLAANRSLVSSISRENVSGRNPVHQIMWGREKNVLVALKTAAVLTCLSKVPPADAFRPAYAGTTKTIYREKELRWNRLQSLKPSGTVPAWEVVERWFERPWLDHMPSWLQGSTLPNENSPGYGREWGRSIGIASLMLQLDVPRPRKRLLAIRLVQLGIDIHGLILTGRKWTADGGHWSGRKWPLLFASIILNEKSMRPASDVTFQEDQQTYYGKGWCGQTALFQMVTHHGPRRPYEERPPAQWDGMDKRSESYRLCCTAQAWIGMALTARLMKAIPVWKHDAFFDYCDRWMSTDDPYVAGRSGKKRPRQEGKTYDRFVDAMWRAHRGNAPKQPMSGVSRQWVWQGRKGSWADTRRP